MRRATLTLSRVQGPTATSRRHLPVPVAWRTARQMEQMSTQAQDLEGSLVRLEHTGGGVSKVTLCRPKKLNSLSLPMIGELKEKYAELGSAGTRCVFLAGEGRALCAGGDVAEVREGVIEGNTYPADFFYNEYSVDYGIATLRERENIMQIALWNGIVMGGGVGLSCHSPIRIATEKTMFAMPETGIGLFPDVGMTHVLSRLKAGLHMGIFIGLTGQRLGAADCLHAGLATHFCPSDKLEEVEDRMRALGDKANDFDAASAAIKEAAGNSTPDTAKAVLMPNAGTIERCFNANVAEDIIRNLEKEASDWAKKQREGLLQKSPTSVKVSLEAIQRHRDVTLKEAFEMEYRLSQWFMRNQPDSDFCEGIRALLIDKDNKPLWNPSRLEDVPKDKVDAFFAPLRSDHPRGELKLS